MFLKLSPLLWWDLGGPFLVCPGGASKGKKWFSLRRGCGNHENRRKIDENRVPRGVRALKSAKKSYKKACDLGYKLGEFFNTLGRRKRNSFSKMACSNLGIIERQLGDFESAKAADEKACGLGFQEACL